MRIAQVLFAAVLGGVLGWFGIRALRQPVWWSRFLVRAKTGRRADDAAALAYAQDRRNRSTLLVPPVFVLFFSLLLLYAAALGLVKWD